MKPPKKTRKRATIDALYDKRHRALKRIVEIWSEIEGEDREALNTAVTIFSLLLARRNEFAGG
jgi:hypothetical protein